MKKASPFTHSKHILVRFKHLKKLHLSIDHLDEHQDGEVSMIFERMIAENNSDYFHKKDLARSYLTYGTDPFCNEAETF